MKLDEIIFLSLCFFTLGFLSIIGFISFFLNYYFKSKVHGYYLAYILATSLFITIVFIINSKIIGTESLVYRLSTLFYDPIQIIIFFLHTSFIYNAMVIENKKFKKLSWAIKLYFILVIIQIIISTQHPELLQNHKIFYIGTRISILLISLIFYIFLFKNITNTYLFLLFIACTILILFGLLALWDSTSNRNNSIFKGFQYICIGYILENICFSISFFYKIVIADKNKNSDKIFYEKQLESVQLEIQNKTMQYIGREIHDNIGQKLTLASLYTQQLGYENKVPQIKDNINTISSIINESLVELRELSRSLTVNTIDSFSIIKLLQQEIDKFDNLSDCFVCFNCEISILEVPYEIKIVLLRITQEFIQNSIKHAKCKKINVSLVKNTNKLELLLQDNGIGFDINLANENGIGLKNIKKRIEIIGGTFDLKSIHTEGTSLNITLLL